MRTTTKTVLLLFGLGILLGVSLAVAASARRSAKTPRSARSAGQALDCKDLEKQLKTCALHVVAAVDPEVAPRLRKMDPALRAAVVKTFTDELIGRVVAPCQRRRGLVPGAGPIARCLAQVKGAGAQTCPKLAACLKTAMDQLPPPKTPKKPK